MEQNLKRQRGRGVRLPPVACNGCGQLTNQSVASVLQGRLPICRKCSFLRSWYERLGDGAVAVPERRMDDAR